MGEAEPSLTKRANAEGGGPGTKYALLFLGRRQHGLDAISFDERTWVIEGQLADMVDLDEVGHWKEWLGTLAWEEVEAEQHMLLTTVATDRVRVLDRDNQTALNRLRRARYVLLLARPALEDFGELRFVSGACEGGTDDLILLDVRSTGTMPALIRPFYMAAPGYIEAVWQTPDDWAARWLAMDQLLGSRGGLERLPRILDLALVGYSHAWQSDLLEFRIPNFLRAAEAVLGLPSGEGMKKRFARRVRSVVGQLDGHAFLRWKGDRVGKHLKDLFQLRSNCVHGKVPFEQLRAQGDEGQLRAARYEYAAEALARDLLVWALSHPRRDQIFKSRAVLEAEWKAAEPPS